MKNNIESDFQPIGNPKSESASAHAGISTKIFKNEDGATAIEYGLIAALIAVAAITTMGALGEELSATFGDVSTELADARTP
jgi:pilus assembly protein Flp/PilA